MSWDQPTPIDLDNLSGRLTTSLTLFPRDRPYIIRADITVMPDVTLTITPGVVLEFAPRVGLLVLGRLVARGKRGEEIIMRPVNDGILYKPSLPFTRRYVIKITVLNVC